LEKDGRHGAGKEKAAGLAAFAYFLSIFRIAGWGRFTANVHGVEVLGNQAGSGGNVTDGT
jgi:hypothetical protein